MATKYRVYLEFTISDSVPVIAENLQDAVNKALVIADNEYGLGKSNTFKIVNVEEIVESNN